MNWRDLYITSNTARSVRLSRLPNSGDQSHNLLTHQCFTVIPNLSSSDTIQFCISPLETLAAIILLANRFSLAQCLLVTGQTPNPICSASFFIRPDALGLLRPGQLALVVAGRSPGNPGHLPETADEENGPLMLPCSTGGPKIDVDQGFTMKLFQFLVSLFQ